ncbi:MAG: DUF2339 domain-containing protein [Verrucomicrobia bacterium]|nr:DUF2339 domain-containing protein [Verrucomicrobiota bacterium]
MLCPKCNAASGERFCPQCGIDLQVYSELTLFRSELESLRLLVLAVSQPSSEVTAPLSGVQGSGASQGGKSPPPLPSEVNKTVQKESPFRGGSAELAVGQKWLLGIGVLILVIGIGFFLKYAFDQQWIGPAVRISIGFIGGVALLLGGSVCRRQQLRGLDIGIGGVGLGALYLTSYAACQVERLLPGSLAVVLILVTTAIGVCLAALWASQALAILTFLGGLLAPLLFASSQFDPGLFLSYLLILTVGGQILAYAKDWRQLYASTAALTWLSVVVWSQRDYRRDWFLETFIFTQVLFAAYSIMPFLRAAFRKEWSLRQGFLLAVINGLCCCWYSESLLNFQKSPGALVSLSYAIVTLGLALVFWRGRTPGLLSIWLIAQASVFLLVFWEQILANSWVTVFWSAELVILYWAAAKSNDRTLFLGTFFIGLIVVLQYFGDAINFVCGPANAGCFTQGAVGRWSGGLSAVLGLLLVVWLDRTGRVAGPHRLLSGAFELLGIMSLFGFANLELERFTTQFMPRIELASVSVLWSGFAVGLMLVGVWTRRKVYRVSAIGLLILTVLKVLALDTAEVSTPYRILSCLVVGVILLAVSFLYYRFSERLSGK